MHDGKGYTLPSYRITHKKEKDASRLTQKSMRNPTFFLREDDLESHEGERNRGDQSAQCSTRNTVSS